MRERNGCLLCLLCSGGTFLEIARDVLLVDDERTGGYSMGFIGAGGNGIDTKESHRSCRPRRGMKWLGDARYEIDCQRLETRDDPEADERFPIAVITKSAPVVEEEW